MSENNGGRDSWRRSKCKTRLCCVVAITTPFLSFAASATCLSFTLIFFCPECANPNPSLLWINAISAVLLLAIGISVIWNLLFRGGTRPTQNSPRNQVIIYEIRTEDLERSPAPVLPCIHNHLQPAFVETSSIDLPPDYLTIAQSCTEGESLAEELPPDYLTAVRNNDINELNLLAFVQTSSIDLPPDYCTVAQSSNTCNDIDVESSSEELPVYFTAVQNYQ